MDRLEVENSTEELQEVDAAAALRELKEEVRRHRHELRGDGALAANDWYESTALDEVQTTARVNPHLPIAWPEWPSGVLPKVVAVMKKVTRRLLRWYINPLIEQQNDFNAATARAMVDLAVELRAADTRLRTEFARTQESVKNSQSELAREHGLIAQRLLRLERRSQTAPAVVETKREMPASPTQAPSPFNVQPLMDYYNFELRHRGSPEAIQKRQESYLPYFQNCRQVLDIGCGRGEFVALLRDHGIDASGVDIDVEMVAHSQADGLPVVQADGLEHLQTLPDDSLDGVFMAQVIEHLTPVQVVQLLQKCYQKLSPNGVVVVETINPTCVFAFFQYYLMDPSHVHPWHPDTVRFLLEDAGFWEIDIKFLSSVPEDQQLTIAPVGGFDVGQVAIMNQNADRLNALLFGFQDYAAVARRPADNLPEISS